MATEGLFYAVTGPGGKKRSVDINAGVFGYANGNSSVGGSELSGVGGVNGGGGEEGTAGWLKGIEDRENNAGGSNGLAICKFFLFFVFFVSSFVSVRLRTLCVFKRVSEVFFFLPGIPGIRQRVL